MSSAVVVLQVARRKSAVALMKRSIASTAAPIKATNQNLAGAVVEPKRRNNSQSSSTKRSLNTTGGGVRAAPAPSVVPATNLGLHSWNEPINNSPRISLSSLAATASDSTEELACTTVDQEILANENDDFLENIDMQSLQKMASQRCTPLKLSDMYKYASMNDPEQRLRNAQFLHKELPIRIAQRAVDLLTLPHGLSQTKPIRHVTQIYVAYLDKLLSTLPNPPTTQLEETKFTDLLQSIVLDRTAIPQSVAQGVASWRLHHPNVSNEDVEEMERALYRFFTARVGLRFLCEHHILSSPKRKEVRQDLLGGNNNNASCQEEEMIGCIQPDCNVVKEIERVAEQVKKQVYECYGFSPEIQIVSCPSEESSQNFTYVPHHLQYMVSELLKNSCRATVQRHLALKLQDPTVCEKSMPPVKIVVAKGLEDVTVKVADRGGGVPRSTMEQIWSFGKSTAPDEEISTEFGTNPFTGGATHGFGLPLARIYARYFGGELTLKSTEGYGLDAYLYLPRLGEACENLPERVTVSPGGQDSYPTAAE